MVRVFPQGAMKTEPAPNGHPRTMPIRVAAALVRKVSPGTVERIKRSIEPAATMEREWLAADIVWADVDEPTVDMSRAVGLAAVCRKPRRDV